MKPSPKLIILAGVAPILTSCTVLSMFGIGANDIVGGTLFAASKGVDLNRQLNDCETMGKAGVPFEEEKVIGGTVAVNWVQRGNGALIKYHADPVPEGSQPAQVAAAVSLVDPSSVNDLNRYVNEVGKNLAAQSGRPTLPWTFGVLNSPGINAVSAPAGYVLVTKGLLNQIQTEAELAGVLAHEIGHVTGRHAINQYIQIKVDSCKGAAKGDFGAAIGSAVVGHVLSHATGGYVNLNSADLYPFLKLMTDKLVEHLLDDGFSKEDEYDADQTAVALLVSAGYNPHDYISFLGRLPKATNHPDNSDRQKRLTAWIETQKPKPGEFGSSGYPFDRYPNVPLHGELDAAKLASAD